MGVQEKTKSSVFDFKTLILIKNNKSIIVVIFLLVVVLVGYFSGLANATTYDYTYTVGGTTAFDAAYGNATDSLGNVYSTGRFRGTNVNFNTTGSGSPDLKTSASSNFFINKINTDGSYGYTYTLAASSSNGMSVASDPSDNLYVAGWFKGSNIDFNITGTGSSDLKTSVAGGTVSSVFVTKIKADGTYDYTYIFGGGTYTNEASSITTDSSGNVYVSGQFSGTNVDFNSTGSGSPDLHTSTGPNGDDVYTDMFITKINANGSYGFTYTTGGEDYDSAQGVTTDSSGNIYVTGFFKGTNINFNTTGVGSPDLHTSTAYTDIFLTKINSNGSYGYTYTIGGASLNSNSGDSVVTDSDGNIYFTGYYLDNAMNFNTTGSGSPDIKNSSGNSAMFLQK